MKKIEWIHGNKMRFESGYKSFDKKVDLITTGNVLGKVQTSGYIRPYDKTDCNGFKFPVGHLQNVDLNGFNKNLPAQMKDFARGKNIAMIGYSFFFWNGDKKVNIGWVLTDAEHRCLMTIYARDTTKTIFALEECKEYITEGGVTIGEVN